MLKRCSIQKRFLLYVHQIQIGLWNKKKREIVKKRAYEILEHNKNVLLPLVERAFLSGAIDIEYAYDSDDIIPSAIVLAAFMGITSDMQSSATDEIIEEADNIYQTL